MKTLKKLTYLVVMISLITFTSCSKNNDNNDDNNSGGEEYLTAKIDGANYEAAQSPAVIVSATISSGIFVLTGGNNNGDTVRATINGYTGTGTYTTGDNINNTNSLSYITLPANSWISTFDIGTGTLNITLEDGEYVEGTFSFEGYNAMDQTTKNITNGKFRAKLE